MAVADTQPFPFIEQPQLGIYSPHQKDEMPSVREKLPERRRNITQKVKVAGQSIYYSFGLYPDGRPGELFIDVAKAGAALRNWAGEAGMMLSIALQHRTPLETILGLFIGTKCEPSGDVKGHLFILRCSSIMDLIARDMAVTFLHLNQYRDVPKEVEGL